MQSRWSVRRRSTWVLASAPILAVASMYLATAGPAAAHNQAPRHASVLTVGRHDSLIPRSTNMLDCNGWSPKYHSANPGFRRLCTDPRGKKHAYWMNGAPGYSGWARGRFVDNGHYVGHDEPSVKFISSTANSGNTMTYFMKLPKDPAKAATNNLSVVKYAELSPAPWFGLPICDPGSYPQNPCTPDSDTNTGLNSPTDAGSAFMELQWYPPGFAPFADNVSCSAKKWCVAMTIDSLESQFNFKNLNFNCVEPVNFAYLQKNGVPAGPPSPQLANGHTFTPNAHTLEMNFGDVLKVSISDPSAGFTTTVQDLTTGQTGTMTASATNGFASTNYLNCDGTPFTFHAEYATAAPANQVPWAALEGGVLMQQEIGHSEVCASLANSDPTHAAGLSDPSTFDTCVGGAEGAHKTGEGSCNPNTGVCHNAETEGTTGPIACPSNNFASGQLCEYGDGICVRQGTRTVTLLGVKTKETSPVNWCQAGRFQNGDLDFDGTDYQKTTWPNGSANVPTSFRYAGPFDAAGKPYPQIQFETDAAGSEFLCNVFDGNLCLAPPLAAKFYPFWTMTNKPGQGIGTSTNALFPAPDCIWNFGNVITGATTRAFGKDKQYGLPDIARFGGTLTSPVIANPEINGNCPALTNPLP